MTATYADFEGHSLDDGHPFFVGRLPEDLRPDADGFEELWALHPDSYHVIQMHGRPVETPRWQQAYGGMATIRDKLGHWKFGPLPMAVRAGASTASEGAIGSRDIGRHQATYRATVAFRLRCSTS